MNTYELKLTNENLLQVLSRDEIGRSAFVFRLVRILDTIDTGLSLAIDGDWGSGKTFLLNEVKLLTDPVLLPHFSCHSLRHTFATRMCEQGVNIKVIQDILGHADVTTTLNIYADATKDLKKKVFIDLNKAFAAEK